MQHDLTIWCAHTPACLTSQKKEQYATKGPTSKVTRGACEVTGNNENHHRWAGASCCGGMPKRCKEVEKLPFHQVPG